MKTILVMTAAIVVFGLVAQAGDVPDGISMVPEYINYQARLVSPSGTPYADTTHKVELRLFEEAGGGGDLLWGESYTVQTRDGYFSILLGSGGTALDGSTNEIWEVMWQDGGSPNAFFMSVTALTDDNGSMLAVPQEATPRQQFVTAPFAFRAHQSKYASRADGQFSAPEGIETPSIVNDSDVVVTAPLRLEGDNALHTSRVTANPNSILEIRGDPGKVVEIAADGAGLQLGRVTPAGEPTVVSSYVTVGHSEGNTYVNGQDVNINAATGESVVLNAADGTVYVGYKPASPPYIPSQGASRVQVGRSTTDVDIYYSDLSFNPPLFDFQKVTVTKNSGSFWGTANITGINHNQYDIIVVGWESTNLEDIGGVYATITLGTPRARVSCHTTTSAGTVVVRVLGIRKGLISGFTY